MNRDPAVMACIIQEFATELTRAPLYECGHADAWQKVQRADASEDLLLALGYCEGYADCARLACPWDSPAWRIAGWKRGAKQNPIPTSATQRATPAGPRSMVTPSASRTSADPQTDDDARPRRTRGQQ